MDPRSNNSHLRIALICLDPSAVPAFQIFNPNDWKRGGSKAVVQSCSSEFSVLQYGVARIAEMCRSPKGCCQSHFENLKRQWSDPAKSLSRTVCYAQVPDLHVFIEAFFSGMKSLLDLIVQLLSTENVVRVKLHGFHKVKGIYGGRVLNALDHNASSDKKDVAKAFKNLITEHKQCWIDELIKSRDLLVHPTKGADQLMFGMRLAVQDGALVYEDAVPPFVGDDSIDHYSATQLKNIQEFAGLFLEILR